MIEGHSNYYGFREGRYSELLCEEICEAVFDAAEL